MQDLLALLRSGDEEIENEEGDRINVVAEASWTLLFMALDFGFDIDSVEDSEMRAKLKS